MFDDNDSFWWRRGLKEYFSNDGVTERIGVAKWSRKLHSSIVFDIIRLVWGILEIILSKDDVISLFQLLASIAFPWAEFT